MFPCVDHSPADPGPLSSAPRPSARLSKAFLKPSSDDEDPPRTLGQLRPGPPAGRGGGPQAGRGGGPAPGSGPPEEPRQGDEKETEATAASSSSRSVTGLQPPPRLAG